MLKLYDLEFLNKPRTPISPNVAKIRYALQFKKIPFDIEWVNLTSIVDILPPITKDNNKRPQVPVIIHDNHVVIDSWTIALYLEEAFPDTPSLFHQSQGVHKFFQNYVDKHVMPILFKCICLDMCQAAGPPPCQARFRQLKEGDIGRTLEEFHGDEERNKELLKQALIPIHQSLGQFPFITGEQPGWADIVLASTFTPVIELRPDLFQEYVLDIFKDDLIQIWWHKMKNLTAYK